MIIITIYMSYEGGKNQFLKHDFVSFDWFEPNVISMTATRDFGKDFPPFQLSLLTSNVADWFYFFHHKNQMEKNVF